MSSKTHGYSGELGFMRFIVEMLEVKYSRELSGIIVIIWTISLKYIDLSYVHALLAKITKDVSFASFSKKKVEECTLWGS